MKRCFKCGQEKDITEFYKHPRMTDGHLGKCKDCTRKDVKDNRLKRVDYYREYSKRKFRETTDFSSRRAYDRQWKRKHHYLHNRVERAIKKGLLVKQPCELCGEPVVHAHHDDYSKPLEVRWLCPVHHSALHHARSL